MPRSHILVVALVVIATTSAPVRAQSAPPIDLQRLTGAITINGVPDESAWEAIAPLDMTQYIPDFRARPSMRTAIRVGYDDDALYIAGVMQDPNPGGIRINSLYRDRWNGDDALALYIDSFNDNRNSKWFGVTAAGMRFDELISDDGATFNGSWDSFWTARSVVTDSGWTVEVRIPFSTIGFQVDAEGKAVMGLTVTRLVSRLGERVTFPAIDPKFDFRRPSMAQDVVVRGVQASRPLYVTPYVLAGASRTPTTARGTHETTRDLGLDIRYPVTGELTLDLTVNTDFAQVEADDQQVNLDRFPLFFPERRRFFQEGSGIFDFVTAGNLRLFNSRRIGLTPQLVPVPVRGGARLVGRAGQWDVGLLGIQTASQDSTPTENFGVLRVKRPVLNAYSAVGLMLTGYQSDGRTNLALGIDGVFRAPHDHFLSLKVATTNDSQQADTSTFITRSVFDASLERRVGRGLQYNLTVSRTGRDLRPELGFQPRTNYTIANAVGNYYFFTDSSRYFRRVYPGALYFATLRNRNGAMESSQYAVWVQWDTRAGGGGWIEPKGFHENVAAPFTIANKVHIPAGAYDFADLQLVYQMPSGRRLRTSVDFRSGTYFDGRRTQVTMRPTWNASRHLELGGAYQASLLRFPVRDEQANIHVVNMRIGTALDARKSGTALVQYNSTTDRLDFNVRLRYAFTEGTDLWVVYNEGLDVDRPRGLADAQPLSLSRALIVKYSRTFGF